MHWFFLLKSLLTLIPGTSSCPLDFRRSSGSSGCTSGRTWGSTWKNKTFGAIFPFFTAYDRCAQLPVFLRSGGGKRNLLLFFSWLRQSVCCVIKYSPRGCCQNAAVYFLQQFSFCRWLGNRCKKATCKRASNKKWVLNNIFLAIL